ncbi:hypothetical protein Asi03nite_46390 [Actinoplanes siamensis]|uniref:FAD dependent oxidoreductase domain-containing protein n=1 Tax=Actinoplanes siamensis TaxID=1223317 RepID=A0A919TLE4_9ACTN|nr:FAD-dependent oxidoreductase [Actinoplanes siamensis]GIF07101.1 hypothetical protein Asi03nite_46390 [Actinoplanes siamensis]
MNVAVIGGGLAGSLLAWRLAQYRGIRVTLYAAAAGGATAVSGGLVRCFEPDPVNAAAAAAGLAELLSSPVLAGWAGFRATGSVYVCPGVPDPAALAAAAGPGHLDLCDPAQLRARWGLAGLPDGATGVVEPTAGYLSPARLAAAVRRDLLDRGGVLLPVAVRQVRAGAGRPQLLSGDTWIDADVVVVAAGAWTGALLPGTGLRTKAVQYVVCRARGPLPPAFVDETSGLYGRPDGPGRLLLGLPTDRWDVPAHTDRFDPACLPRLRSRVRERLPGVRLGAVSAQVAAADGYSPDGRLALRRAPGTDLPLYTFAGGSGGAAKTALAVSAEAAARLLAGTPAPTGGER